MIYVCHSHNSNSPNTSFQDRPHGYCYWVCSYPYHIGYIYIVPSVILFLCISIVPSVYLLMTPFHDHAVPRSIFASSFQMYVNQATLEAIASTPLPTPTPASGAFYHHTSTVTRLGANGHGTAQVPITEVAEGSRILALDQHATPFFAKIEGFPHGPSAEPFMHIVMNGERQRELKATLYHTFDTCVHGHNPFERAAKGLHEAAVMAKDIKAGNCLHTAEGKRTVRSVTRTAVQDGDVTYSIKLENGTSTVAVGGVFTHSMGRHKKENHKGAIS